MAEGGERLEKYKERRRQLMRALRAGRVKGQYRKCSCSPCRNVAVYIRPVQLCQECHDAMADYAKWKNDNPDLAPLTEGKNCRSNRSLSLAGKLLYAGSRAHMEPLIEQHSRRVMRELSHESRSGSTRKGTRGSG